MAKTGPPPDQARRDQVMRMVLQGYSYTVIGKDMGITRQRVAAIVKQAGLRREFRYVKLEETAQ